MFDFEKLDVYKKAKIFNSGIRDFIRNTRLDGTTTKDQLGRTFKELRIRLNFSKESRSGWGRFSDSEDADSEDAASIPP